MPDPEPTPEAVAVEPRGAGRLGIIHLMLWTAGAAVILMLQRLRAEMMTALPFEVPGRQVADIVHALADGAAVGALPLWIALRRRGGAFLRQPGEWLLICRGGAALLNEVVTLLMLRVAISNLVVHESMRWGMYMALALQALAAFLFLLPLFWLRDGRWWWTFFFLCGMVPLAQTLLLLLHQFDYLSIRPAVIFLYLDYLPSLVLLIAVAQDVRRRESRDWTHYAGVGVYCAIEIGMRAVFWLRRYW